MRISDWSSDVCSSDRLGGGIERGSSVLVLGPAGTGKSLLALTFVTAAVARGEKAAMFVFDEEMGLLFNRALGLGIDMRAMADSGDDRKSVVEGKSVSVSVDIGGRRLMKQKNTQ